MSRLTITRDLYSLVPALGSNLPKELIDLTSSLIAQSRNQVATLKPQEEPARGYICAHIACERLKGKLDLPDITGNKPIPPKKYTDLYAYFEKALKPSLPHRKQNDANTPSPSKTRNAQSTKSSKTKLTQPSNNGSSARKVLPTRSTPSSSKQTTSKGTATTRFKDAITHITPRTQDREFPAWIMKSIREICVSWKIPAATPHIFAGVSSVARLLASQAVSKTPTKSRRTVASELEKYPLKLSPALTFAIAIDLATLFSSVPTEAEYLEKQKQVYTVFVAHMPTPKNVISDSEEERTETESFSSRTARIRSAEGGDLLLPKDAYETLLAEYVTILDEEWVSMDWYQNAQEAAKTSKEDEDETIGASSESDDDHDHNTAIGKSADDNSIDENDGWVTDSKQTFDLKLRKRKSPVTGEEEAEFALQVHNRIGGEMRNMISPWTGLQSRQEYKQWERDTRALIASKRAKHHVE